jgi:quinohemoprotein amine dehydrogenase
MKNRALAATSLMFAGALSVALMAQAPQPTAAPTAKPEEGIPITDATVLKACGTCHRPDDKGQLSRISFQRNTPEGWQLVIQRMASLNGLNIEPETARQVVKYLSNNLGLAPEEAKASAWDAERRPNDFKYTASADAESTCNKCHSLGRVISQRRTKTEWDLLIAMHRGWYPLVDNQAFRRNGPPPPAPPSADGRPADNRHPIEKALDHLVKTFPLKTPEWTAWSANMRPARLDGTWALSGWEQGKGAIYGRVTITADSSSPEEFTTSATYRVARTGQTITRTGRGIVYTGFQWRGRSSAPGADSAMREVMTVDRDWRSIDGRWFTGGYDVLGIDVKLERVAGDARALGTDRTALKQGAAAQPLKIYGVNLGTLQPRDIDLGPGLTVTRIVEATPDVVTVAVDVAAGAAPGSRDLFVAGASRAKALAVYDKIDGIKVKPDWAMARVGGDTFPKMLAQFEAWAYSNGADGKPDSPDDIDLGMVDAAWSMEEYAATYNDDDIKFVGVLNEATGRFTPNVDGPNTTRVGSRNNVGDVWVVANYVGDAVAGKTAPTFRARAHLLVTVPLYMKFDPSRTQ